MSSKQSMSILFVGLSLAFSLDARANPEVLGADRAAQGGTSLAVDDSNAAVSKNPGLLALNRRYDFGAQFGYGPQAGLHWAAGGVDSKTSDVVALGFQYAGDRFEPELRTEELPGWWEVGQDIPNVKRQHDFVLGLAAPIVEGKLSVGLGGHFTVYDNDRNGKGTSGNLDAGFGWKASDYVTLGVAGNNLLPFDPLSDRPLSVAGGVSVDGPSAGIAVDGGYQDGLGEGPPVYVASGAEVKPGVGRIRAGYRYEGVAERSIVTAGVGVFSEGGAVEYGIDVPIGEGWSALAHVIGIRFGAPPGINPP